MLKKHRVSQMFYPTSLAHISQLRNNYQAQIQKLFSVEKRQQFQLDYLYETQHFTTSQAYQQLVQLLQRYNEYAQKFNDSNTTIDKNSSFSVVKLACMKIIYKQMLIMATMKSKELKENSLPEKLKEWFQHLADVRNFFDGVNIKKKDFSLIESQEQKAIRASYISNVFDQLDDYLRKRMDYSKKTCSQQNSLKKSRIKDNSNCNLPSIDIMLYKREDLRMREYREKQFDKNYLSTMINNRNKMRETSMSKLRGKYNVREASSSSYHSNMFTRSNSGNKIMPLTFYGRKNTYFNKENITNKHEQLSKHRLTDPNRLTLQSINGINLIQNKPL